MRPVSITLDSSIDTYISIPNTELYVHIFPIEKESIIKIYLFDSAYKIDMLYRDKEKIIFKVNTKPETIFIVTESYIVELRNVINIYILKNYEKLDIDKIKIDVDIETEYYNNDYDTRFYLKIQTE